MTTAPAAANASQVIKVALGKIGDIATLPEVTTRIIAVVDDPKSTARDLHNIIKNDPALAARILKVVNSAFYGLPGQVSEIDRAIVLLGLSAVKNIAISASISRLFSGDRISDKFSARDIWKHSVAVAVATRQLCVLMGRRPFAEEAFLAGLIHDLGMLVERQAYPEQLAEAIRVCTREGRSFCEIETEIIGADHQAMGSALAAKWKFPRALQTVMGYHHKVDNLTEEHRVLPSMVFAADVLCCHEQVGFYLTAQNQTLEDILLQSLGVTVEQFTDLREQLPEQIATAEAILTG